MNTFPTHHASDDPDNNPDNTAILARLRRNHHNLTRRLERALPADLALPEPATPDPTTAPGTQTKPKVFINYRAENGGYAATVLEHELTRRLGNAAVFLDQQSIAPAQDFPSETLDKIRNCALFLVVIGPGWEHTQTPDGNRRLADENDWVRREIREAASYHVPVLPVLVGTRPHLAAADLPDDIQFLAELPFLHLPDGFKPSHVALAFDARLRRSRRLDVRPRE